MLYEELPAGAFQRLPLGTGNTRRTHLAAASRQRPPQYRVRTARLADLIVSGRGPAPQ